MSKGKPNTIRAPRDKDHPYYATRRATAQDKKLSYEALGMLSYLLSKPADWEVMPDELVREGCGRDKVYRILKELKTKGYIARDRHQTPEGKFVWDDYRVYEIPRATKSAPKDDPFPEKPDMEKPDNNIQNIESTEADAGASESDETDEPENAETRPNGFRDIQIAVNEVFKAGDPKMFGVSGDLAHMMMGDSGKTQYQAWNFDTPVTPAEVKGFGVWWSKKRDRTGQALEMVKKPQSIYEEFSAFRRSADYRDCVSAVTVKPPEPAGPSHQMINMKIALEANREANHVSK